MLLLSLIIVPWRIFLPARYNSYLLGFMTMISALLFNFFITYNVWHQKQQFKFLENEGKWSDLVHTINAKTVKDSGLRASHCYEADKRNSAFPCQTMGLEFTMEPGMDNISP